MNIHFIIQIKAKAGHCGSWWPVGILFRFEDYQGTEASWTKEVTSNWFRPLFCSFLSCSTNSMSFTLHDTTSPTYFSVVKVRKTFLKMANTMPCVGRRCLNPNFLSRWHIMSNSGSLFWASKGDIIRINQLLFNDEQLRFWKCLLLHFSRYFHVAILFRMLNEIFWRSYIKKSQTRKI